MSVCVSEGGARTALACLGVKGWYPNFYHSNRTLQGRAAWQAGRESKRTLPQDDSETFSVSGIFQVIDSVKELPCISVSPSVKLRELIGDAVCFLGIE